MTAAGATPGAGGLAGAGARPVPEGARPGGGGVSGAGARPVPEGAPSVSVVVPTVGRPSLMALLCSLAASHGPLPEAVVLVDDRREPHAPLLASPPPPRLEGRVRVLRAGGRGPAAARNRGWRAVTSDWVAFLDDDVVVDRDWLELLAADLAGAAPHTGGVQGRLRVPLPPDRRPTDWERNVAGLERARWATADLAYRRDVLRLVGGFDERFPRAYREDADLGLRVAEHVFGIACGRRAVTHPVHPAGRWVSVRLQAGNADDALMLLRHGWRWRERSGVPRGRRRPHLAVTAAGVAAAASAARGRRAAAGAAAAAWLAGTAGFALSRIRPGPRTAGEVVTMAATSVAIPPLATWHWLAGLARGLAGLRPAHGPGARRTAAVLFDRDGTLIADTPYNGDPALVEPMPGAGEALRRLQAAGVRTAVVSNQSGVGHGLVTEAQVRAVSRRVEELLGPVGPWLVCPHAPGDGCDCRKPAPGLVLRAAEELGVEPQRCVVVGDIGGDVDAARAAGARAVLVPTSATRPEEVAAAPCVAADLPAAVDLILRGAV